MSVVETFSSATSTTWTCPVGVTAVDVECWGAGGGGGANTGGEGGGGGGAYSKTASVAVTAGVGYSIVVGAGGPPNTTGGDTYFNSAATVMAKGGVRGNGRVGGAGGAAASGVGTTKYSGGNGGNGVAGSPAAGGGSGSSAGTGSNGNNGGNAAGTIGGSGGAAPTGGGGGKKGGNSSNAGVNGDSPGGGGSGGGSGANAGSGADGKLTLTYTQTITGDSDVTMSAASADVTGTETFSGDVDVTLGSLDADVDGTVTNPAASYPLAGGGMCATNVGPLEIGLNLTFPVLLVNASNEGATAVADTDIHIATVDPSGNHTALTWGAGATWTEIDSTDFEGAYTVTVDADQFDEPGVWYVLVYPATVGAYYGIPCNLVCEVVNKQWPRFGPDFDSLFQRMKLLLDREGIDP